MAVNLFDLRYSQNTTHTGATTSAKISPNGQLLATASADTTIKIFSLADGQFIRTLQGHSKGINDLSWSPDSHFLASVSDDTTLMVWDVEYDECVRVLEGHTYHVTCVGFNYKGNVLVTGSSDEAIRIWDPKQRKCLKTLSAHSDPIASIDLCWDASMIASASYDGMIRLFDTESGQCLKTLIYDKGGSSFPVSYIRFSPNGKYLLASTLDNTIRLWDYMNNKVVKTFQGALLEKFSCSSRFVTATDEPMIASGSESGSIVFWSLQTKKVTSMIEISKGSPVIEIDLHDKTLTAVSLDGTLKVFDLASY
ncbi:CYFA0S05e02256g1_1 [Cyberlindnera fabianii]|uniref:CYFA0S05e02256g1_1 n=1 Tax=Cyberlindnera fabianii TaxID=36022 RepID=A0A061ASQ8_CYBFA|nr:CYFA0S05e02256g1_1 [Cyberlindnera fabianii]